MTRPVDRPHRKHGRPQGLKDRLPRRCKYSFAQMQAVHDLSRTVKSYTVIAKATGVHRRTVEWYLIGNWPRAFLEARVSGDDVRAMPETRKPRAKPNLYVPTWD